MSWFPGVLDLCAFWFMVCNTCKRASTHYSMWLQGFHSHPDLQAKVALLPWQLPGLVSTVLCWAGRRNQSYPEWHLDPPSKRPRVSQERERKGRREQEDREGYWCWVSWLREKGGKENRENMGHLLSHVRTRKRGRLKGILRELVVWDKRSLMVLSKRI